MGNMKSLARDTAIYGLSSIVGRFLNYLLMPLYTHVISASQGGYGVVTNLYAYTALVLVMLTFGMETTFFRFANKGDDEPDTVFTAAFALVTALALAFLLGVWWQADGIAALLGYSGHVSYILMMAMVVSLDAIQAIPFCLLRYQGHAVRFACLKLLFIVLNIGLNLYFFLWVGVTDVWYVFMLNLVCTGIISFFFVPDLLRIRWHFSLSLLLRMLGYSWPILVLGIAGILNQAVDKMIYPLVCPDQAEGIRQLGIYGACVKVAMIMAMITQAFRYAYEPFVFARSRDADQRQTYALGMKYFIIFTLLAFLCVMGGMPLLKHLIGAGYREGLGVVPIVMAAEIMMGIYFNLSFWYKLIDKTIFGAVFSLAGCTVLIAVNVLFIPRYGYMACAWGGFLGYATAMVLSYVVGQHYSPIRYPLGSIAVYVLLAAFLYGLMTLVPGQWPDVARLAVNAVLVMAYVGHVLWHDFPLSGLPVVGRYFKKT
ncbi:MAG: lipopolysaccharide biosynthesis protein [Prevotellaceae bacterium]|nr:lipopolysaccharide biosynthesis protein [Prevotellaceae bacterium]